jgi:hypothetical protein
MPQKKKKHPLSFSTPDPTNRGPKSMKRKPKKASRRRRRRTLPAGLNPCDEQIHRNNSNRAVAVSISLKPTTPDDHNKNPKTLERSHHLGPVYSTSSITITITIWIVAADG